MKGWGRPKHLLLHPLVQCKNCKANANIPCRATKCLYCVFPIWFTQYDSIWFTHAMLRSCCARAMPRPCLSESDFSRPRHSAAWARHGMAWNVWISIGRPDTACRRPARIRLLPSTTRRYTMVVNQKHTNPLNCRTSNSNISGYHADFHEGQGTVGEWQGRGMACVN
jgi:hypothetical protein